MKPILPLFFILITVFYSNVNYALTFTYTPSTEKITTDIRQTLIKSVPKEKKATVEIYTLSAEYPLWQQNSQIAKALSILDSAHYKGLIKQDYHVQWLHAQWNLLGDAPFPSFYQLALFEHTLTNNLLHYYSDLQYGRIKPKRVGFFLHPKKDPAHLAQQVFDAIHQDRLQALSQASEPTFFLYQNLRQALNNYQKIALKYPNLSFKRSASLKQGGRGQQVLKLRHLLITLEDFSFDETDDLKDLDSDFFDKKMVVALKHYQKRHQIKATGSVDARTLKVLNVPLSKRMDKIALGLERLRWQPRYHEDQLILVNIPSFRLWAYRSLKEKPYTSRVVVGKRKGSKTPVLSSKMNFVVFRPYWGIPTSILKKEIFPGMRRSSSYLARHNMEMVRGRVRQRPGRGNALGLVKFIFPNHHSIYLHDTPSKHLFRRSRRDYSHGCIRVHQPQNLASYLLKWNKTKVKKAMHSKRNNRWVKLKKKIPIMVFYSTVLALEDPTVTFISDIYHHDSLLLKILKQKNNEV